MICGRLKRLVYISYINQGEMLESLEKNRANLCFNVKCTQAINNNHIFTHIPRELKSHLCQLLKQCY